jgi:serine/threonine-protein kinase
MALGERRIDGRADIYSLGCVAYWLLTGQPVFDRETPMKVVLAHIQEEPVHPSRVSEIEIPDSLERIVMSCLEKDPARRPQTAENVARLLNDCRFETDWSEERANEWWEVHHPMEEEGAALSDTESLSEESREDVKTSPVPRMIIRKHD